jgi:hypothetical protein
VSSRVREIQHENIAITEQASAKTSGLLTRKKIGVPGERSPFFVPFIVDCVLLTGMLPVFIVYLLVLE